MAEIIRIKTPLTASMACSLNAGDEVLISGGVYTARDIAHKRLCQLLDAGKDLPVDLTDAVIYFVGPSPARPGRAVGSAGPTTSGRMDRFTPRLLAAGLRGTIGKGYRDDSVRTALQEFGSVHFAAIGGAGALLSEHIISADIVAYEDLGTEAVRRLEFRDFPAIVAYDSKGNTVYTTE